MLSADEHARFSSVIREVARDRLVVARSVLRHVLAGYLEVEPGDVAFVYSPRGKPGMPLSSLAFNVSHSGGLAAVAVTSRPAVGVDIEVVEAAARGEAFLRDWTAKEAYGKAVGAGRAVDLDRVVVEDGWSLQRFEPAPGAVGAIVAAGGPWRARRREAVRLSA